MNRISKKRISILIVFLILLISILCIYTLNKRNNNIVTQSTNANAKNTYIIQEAMKNNTLKEETLSFENCDYEIDNNRELTLSYYMGQAESIIIPNEIKGHKVKTILPDMFDNDKFLEIIKIPYEIANNIEKINDFERNDELSDEQFVLYSTTKEYNKLYLRWMNLTEDERKNFEVIPSKFIRKTNKQKNQFSKLVGANSCPRKWNLRDDAGINLTVENQGNTGICYSHAVLTSALTNYVLNNSSYKNNPPDLSEWHLAFMSKEGYGGCFDSAYWEYFDKGLGPITQSKWNSVYNSISGNARSQINSFMYNDNNVPSESTYNEIEQHNITPDYYVYGYADQIEDINQLKKLIMKYGSAYTVIVDPKGTYERT